MDQLDYINRIEPAPIVKEGRLRPEVAMNSDVRQICGSLQFAAVHTRPDLAAKVGELQSSITSGTVGDLMQANGYCMRQRPGRFV